MLLAPVSHVSSIHLHAKTYVASQPLHPFTPIPPLPLARGPDFVLIPVEARPEESRAFAVANQPRCAAFEPLCQHRAPQGGILSTCFSSPGVRPLTNHLFARSSQLLNYGERAWCRLETYIFMCLADITGKATHVYGFGEASFRSNFMCFGNTTKEVLRSLRSGTFTLSP